MISLKNITHIAFDADDTLWGHEHVFVDAKARCLKLLKPYMKPGMDLEQELESRHKIYTHKEFLQSLNGKYEQVFIETPPALNFYSLSALIAADRCLIPFDCDAFARDALMDLMQALEEIKEDHNAQLEVEGVIINQFQARAKLPQIAVDELKQAGLNVLTPYLSSSVKMKESHANRTPLIFMEPRHKLSQEFSELFNGLN